MTSSMLSREKDKHTGNRCKRDEFRDLFMTYHLNGNNIGKIQLKYIDFEKHCGTLNIHLQDDSVKGKGYGTEAERLIIDDAFKYLKFNAVYANAVHRNLRSQHVLEKAGFKHTHDDEVLRYYI